jgi:hypothetical protein
VPTRVICEIIEDRISFNNQFFDYYLHLKQRVMFFMGG